MLSPVEQLGNLFEKWSGTKARTILPLPQSGSSRSYYRLSSDTDSAVGVFHVDDKENDAFVYFADHFRNCGIPIPEIYIKDLENKVYLQQDLGDTMLFDLTEKVDDPEVPSQIKAQWPTILLLVFVVLMIVGIWFARRIS